LEFKKSIEEKKGVPGPNGGDQVPGPIGGDQVPGPNGGDQVPGPIGGDQVPGPNGGDQVPGPAYRRDDLMGKTENSDLRHVCNGVIWQVLPLLTVFRQKSRIIDSVLYCSHLPWTF
jgi:hypothetical protein